MTELLRVSNIKKVFGKTEALKGVSFDLKEGEVFSLLGVNGAGKTTLSSIIATLLTATSGDIFLRGKSIYKDVTKFRKDIGYCPQHPNLNMQISMRDNLMQAGKYYGLTGKKLENRYNELIKNFGLEQYQDFFLYALSGGYQRRFLIARSLIHKPSILLLDEPTVGLDPQIRHELWKFIKGLKKLGVTVILTTHYLDEAEELSDRVCLLDKGEIIAIDTPKNLKSKYKKERLEDVFLHLVR